MEASDFDQLRRAYSLNTNEELVRLAAEYEQLTSVAKEALGFELRKRGMEGQGPSSEPIQAVIQSPSETERPRTSRWNWIWPVITNEGEAKNASKSGAGGALFVAVCTGTIAVIAIATRQTILGIDGYGLVDAVLFALIAWRLFKYSFPWAVFGLLLYLAEVYDRVHDEPKRFGAVSVIIIMSLVASLRGTYFLRSRKKLKESGVGAEDTRDNSVVSALPSARPRSLRFGAVPPVIMCVALLATIVYHQARIKENERFAALRAQIDKESDQSVALQIQKDFAVLVKDYKADDWSGFRSELLSREPYLIDLKAQSDKVQRRLMARRNANLNPNDICEQLELDEGEPALEAVIKAQGGLLSFVKSTIQLTADKKSVLLFLDFQNKSAWQQWDQYIADENSHGCNK